ncbi:hypothetical protein [Actinophytocola sp.]
MSGSDGAFAVWTETRSLRKLRSAEKSGRASAEHRTDEDGE